VTVLHAANIDPANISHCKAVYFVVKLCIQIHFFALKRKTFV